MLSKLLSSLPEEFEEVILELGEKEKVEDEAGEGENRFFLPLLLWNLASFSVHFFPLDNGDSVLGFSISVICLGVCNDVLYCAELPKLSNGEIILSVGVCIICTSISPSASSLTSIQLLSKLSRFRTFLTSFFLVSFCHDFWRNSRYLLFRCSYVIDAEKYMMYKFTRYIPIRKKAKKEGKRLS